MAWHHVTAAWASRNVAEEEARHQSEAAWRRRQRLNGINISSRRNNQSAGEASMAKINNLSINQRKRSSIVAAGSGGVAA